MFLIERQIHNIPLSPDSKAEFDKLKKKLAREEKRAAQGAPNDQDPLIQRSASVSKTPDAGRSCYSFNDVFLDLRTPFDEMRGGIFFAAACFLAAPLGVGLPMVFQDLFPELLTGIHSYTGEPLGLDGYFANLFGIVVPLAWIGIGVYFGWRHFRLEAFVQRRLLVRFNRKTRKVYLHRPAYAGGILELPWDEVRPDGVHPDGDEASGVGAPLMLMWLPQHSPRQEIELVLVGRRARSNSEITNLWEFIRRYMEEGPQAVPEPKPIGRFPWPWRGLQSAWSFIWPVWQIESLHWARLLILLGSPAIFLFAVGQWLALLTCWEPVFPKAIRQVCGEGWGSVLKARLIDIGAWGMLAALLAGGYWVAHATGCA